MKYLFAFLLFMCITIPSFGQTWCDSTLTVCDSVSLDSIFFTHTFGDRMHVNMTSYHTHLYAPTFVLCPADQDLELEKNHYGYFSLFGPSTITPYYDFLNFDLIGDSLEGSIILDNTNNGSLNCRVDFQTSVSQNTTGIIGADTEEVFLYPNPVNDFLCFKNQSLSQTIRKVSLVNILGVTKKLNMTLDQIDVRHNVAGVYVVLLELNDGSILSKNIIISPDRH